MKMYCRRGSFWHYALKLEVVLGIVVADVFHHAVEAFFVIGKQSLLHIIAQQIAEQSAEIFMTGIRQERATVGQHTHEATQQSKHREGIHLAGHAIELIVEPPTAAKLNLAGT